MYEEVGDIAGQGAVYSGLGICYKAYGQVSSIEKKKDLCFFSLYKEKDPLSLVSIQRPGHLLQGVRPGVVYRGKKKPLCL
jgi:hypothetical protein